MNWTMPDESEPHVATWMAFGASASQLEAGDVRQVQDALALIANTIARFEPLNMLVRQEELAVAQQKLDPRVNLVIHDMDDLWIRDSGPVFVTSQDGEKAGVDFNFNGWGNKQTATKDSRIADFVIQHTGARKLSTTLVLEGGGIEVDGKGTAIITESCVLNANRNPNLSKAACEAELKALLGVRKVIWLPGIAGKDITDGHTDFYARFAGDGIVVAGYEPRTKSFDHAVTKRHLEILQTATDADGHPLQIVVMEGPKRIRPPDAAEDFAAAYINYYVCNDAVIAPEFGDAQADAAAKSCLMQLFPKRTVVQINIDPLAAAGGGIHCTTQQEPAPR